MYGIRFSWPLVALCLGVGISTPLVQAGPDLRPIHDEFRERLRSLDRWHRDEREALRCRFDDDREQVEEALREARRSCGRDQNYQIARLTRTLQAIHRAYHDDLRDLHDLYVDRRRDLDRWYRLAKTNAIRCETPLSHGALRPRDDDWDRAGTRHPYGDRNRYSERSPWGYR